MKSTSTGNQGPETGSADASESSTRERIVDLVGAKGPIKASVVAGELSLTPHGVRRHLDALEREGIVETRESVAGGRGRPAKVYVLAASSHESMPTRYDEFALAALEHAARTGGEPLVRSLVASYVERLENSLRPIADAAGSEPRDRAAALVEALNSEGYFASVRPAPGNEDSFQICQGHCPLGKVAVAYPDLCSLETDAFARLVGVPVRRLATIARGDHACTTHVGLPGARPPGRSV